MKRFTFLMLIIAICLLTGCQVKDDDVKSDVEQYFLKAGATQCTVYSITHNLTSDGTVDTVTVGVQARSTSQRTFIYEGVIEYVYDEDNREWVRRNDGAWEVINISVDFEATS